MANSSRWALEAPDQDVLLDAFDKFPRKLGAFARAYNLDFRNLRLWASGEPMGAKNYRIIKRLATDLRVDRERTLLAVGIVDRGFGADADSMLMVAKRFGEDRLYKFALGPLLMAFQQLCKDRSLEVAAGVLPQLLYTGYRFCDPKAFCDHLRLHVVPVLYQDDRRCVADDLLRWTCASQVACAANELRCRPVADEFFGNETRVRQLLGHRDVPAWLGPQLRRNHAHYWLWHKSGRYLDRASHLVDEAQQMDSSVSNGRSVAHCRCDLFLFHRDYRRAWEAIAPHYFDVRTSLSRKCPITLGVPALQAYSILLHGTVTRSALMAEDYSREEHLLDITTLKYWLNEFGGHIDAGFTYALFVNDTWASPDLQNIVNRSRHATLAEEETLPLHNLSLRLR